MRDRDIRQLKIKIKIKNNIINLKIRRNYKIRLNKEIVNDK